MTLNKSPVLNLCLECHRRLKTCVCEQIRPFNTQSRFIILMHPMEFKREKLGTGKFSQLILKNSEILVGIDFNESQRLTELLDDARYETFVLYPGENTIDLSSNQFILPQERLPQFIIIDGTWACARKIMRLSTLLHSLPRVSFKTDRRSEFRIKQQPDKLCLSSVESLHQVLIELNRIGIENTENAHQNLMDVFHFSVNQQIELAKDSELRGYRKKNYSDPEVRKDSKRYKRRNLFFKN